MPPRAHPRGFTLLELVVVLLLMALATALVAPALLSAKRSRPGLESLIPTVRAAAARRGEVIYLRIADSGQWRMEGAASAAAAPIATGRLTPFPGLPLTLIVSPIGSCNFDVRSVAHARVIRLDPLTCEITSSS